MAELRDDAYIVVQGWMRKLGLSGAKLLVYAAVYGFSQDGVNEYSGSQKWLAEFVGITPRCLQKVFADLIAEGLIEKSERNDKLGTTNGYRAKRGYEQSSHPIEEGGTNKVRRGYEQSSQGVRTNDVPKYKDKNKYKNNTSEESKEDISKEYLSMLTLEELQANQAFLMAYNPTTVEELDKVLNDISLYEEEIERRSPKSDIQENEDSENDQTGRPEQVESKAKRYQSQSYDEIIKSYEFGPGVANRLKEFIRHCYAGKQFVSNERLHLLCGKLFAVWEVHPGESADEIARRQIEVINRAISGGYYDFLVK